MNSEVHIELLDPRHVIMRFSSQEDFIQAWTRESLVIKAYYFNSPGLLGLIRGLNLLLHRFFFISLPLNPDYLKSIAGVIGRVLRFDGRVGVARPLCKYNARVCVEIDLLS